MLKKLVRGVVAVSLFIFLIAMISLFVGWVLGGS